jgi:hypothetical protein
VNPLTEAREHIHSVLRGALPTGIQIFPEPPETIPGTCVVLVPGASPWATRSRLSGVWEVSIDVTALTPALGGHLIVRRLEELAVDISTALDGALELSLDRAQVWGGVSCFAASLNCVVAVQPNP